ncbi:MAG: DUF389 domain-containing protein [Gemmatimonadaceae bacterium]
MTSLLHRFAIRVQHEAASAIGIDENGRTETVVAMLANNARRAPGYWIQLALSAGIATLGLVLNSTAVVIGAMLVSPLMGPIIELGMGFAVGSPLLLMRAFVRVTLSIIVATGFSALITLALPFHEMTGEITARIAPTALDLLVAVFCALTAAYTTVRPGSDTTAAAAGTAIGIALVPPLCTVGFGLGTGSMAVARGSALLFTANLSGILVLSVLSFLLIGYNQVDAVALERGFVDHDDTRTDKVAARLQRGLHHILGSKFSLPTRVIVPTVFLLAVFFPLRQALTEVTWEVRARAAVRRIVSDISPTSVQTQLSIERRSLSLRVLIVGTTKRAVAVEDSLIGLIRRATGVTPSVTVVALPNARALLAIATTDAQAPRKATPAQALADLRGNVSAALVAAWPPAAGTPLGWNLEMSADDTARVTLRYLGPPLGPSGDELLTRALGARLNSPVVAHTIPVPSSVFAAAPRRESTWIDSTLVLLREVALTDSAVACVRGPIANSRRLTTAQKAIATRLLTSAFGQTGRLTVSDATRWDVRISTTPCAAAPPRSDAAPARPPR